MYYKQKGFVPAVFLAICKLGLMFGGVYTIANVYFAIVRFSNSPDRVFSLIRSLVILISFLLFITIITYLLAGMFLTYRITSQGIRYYYFTLFGGFVLWESVEGLTELKWPRGGYALHIRRKRGAFFLSNWMNTLYGLIFLGYPDPILIILKSIQNQGQMIEEINNHLPSPTTATATG